MDSFAEIDALLKEEVCLPYDNQEHKDTEEYTDFVMQEILNGSVSIDGPEASITATSAATEGGDCDCVPVNRVLPSVNHQPSTSNTQDLVVIPNGNLAAVTASFQLAGYRVVIPVSAVTRPLPQLIAIPSVPQVAAETPVVVAAEPPVVAAETPVQVFESSGARKRKLYEEGEFSDPEMEKKRRNAVNAKNHRLKTKHQIQDLTEKLNKVEAERDEFSVENKRLKTENDQLKAAMANEKRLQDTEALMGELLTLREENARLQQLGTSVALQLKQEKIGLDPFDLLPDDFYKF